MLLVFILKTKRAITRTSLKNNKFNFNEKLKVKFSYSQFILFTIILYGFKEVFYENHSLYIYIYTFEVNILINNKQYIRFELITINNIV